jgi:hypothetical protein
MRPSVLINLVNNSFKVFIGNSFQLERSKYNAFSFVTQGKSLALNRFPNDAEKVKVIEWFDEFWLFLEIKFKPAERKVGKNDKSPMNTIISLSVFQGEESDEKKYQLFRAEWDDYNDPKEKRAQPHWHITSSQAIESTFEEYTDVFERPEILQVLEKEKEKVLDVKKIHFAMNANWQETNGLHIHKIKDEEQVVRWLQKMLTYLRTELNG